MSVLDNVAYGLKQRKIPKGQRYVMAHSVLQLVQLTGRDEARPAMLSGGVLIGGSVRHSRVVQGRHERNAEPVPQHIDDRDA